MGAVLLPGCQPEPLGAYLKALGVLRLVAEQVDPAAHGNWTEAGFVLTSTLDLDGLVTFFADAYVPTPIVSPWLGGSGFMPWDKDDVLQQILRTTDQRFREYALAIDIGRAVHQATAKRLGLVAPDSWTQTLKDKYKDALKADLASVLSG